MAEWTEITVSGAGTTEVNTSYIGIICGDYPSFFALDIVCQIARTLDGWDIYFGEDLVYQSEDNVATPDLVTTWGVIGGESPGPTSITVRTIGGEAAGGLMTHPGMTGGTNG